MEAGRVPGSTWRSGQAMVEKISVLLTQVYQQSLLRRILEGQIDDLRPTPAGHPLELSHAAGREQC